MGLVGLGTGYVADMPWFLDLSQVTNTSHLVLDKDGPSIWVFSVESAWPDSIVDESIRIYVLRRWGK